MLITIVIPTIDRGTLQRAIDSAKAQGLTVILATDRCDPPPLGEDERVRGSWGDGKGPRNAALKLVTTPWCGFLDDDDILLPNYRAAFERSIDQAPDKDIYLFKMRFGSDRVPGRKSGEVLWRDAEFRRGNVGISFGIRTSLAQERPFPSARPAEDFFFLQQFSEEQMCFVDEIVYEIRPR